MELSINQTLQHAASLHADGDLREAEDLYRAVLRQQPGQPDASHNLGVLAIDEGYTKKALPLLIAAIQSDPNRELFWFSYIDGLIKDGNVEEAERTLLDVKQAGASLAGVDSLERLLAQAFSAHEDSDHPMLASEDGCEKDKNEERSTRDRLSHSTSGPDKKKINNLLELYQSGNLAEAELLALSFTENFPSHQFGWKVLGAVYDQMGRFNESLAAINQSLALVPADAEEHYNLAGLLSKLGRLDEAVASFSHAIKLKPDFAEAHYNLASIFKELDRQQDAESSYRCAIVSRPDYAEAHFNLAITLGELGRISEAEDSYRKTILVQPNFAEAHFNLGNLLKNLGKLADAETAYRQACSVNPEFVEAQGNLGLVLYEQRKLEAAESQFLIAIALKSDYVEALSNLGLTLKGLGKLDEAKEALQRAVATNPNQVEAHCNLGHTLRELGHLDEAEASYSQALTLDPGYSEARVNRSQVRYETGRIDAALTDLDSCNSADARARALEMLYAAGRHEEVYERIERRAGLDDTNIRMAAFSAFISEKLKKPTAHNFCQRPLSFFHSSSISSHVNDVAGFISGLVDDLYTIETTWEPAGKATVSGFQMADHVALFDQDSPYIQNLKSIIFDEIEKYRERFKDESCALINDYPVESTLAGWHVVLKRQGYQNPHIHPWGWISGVVYLKLPPSLGRDEGATEFSLNGDFYSDPKSSSLLLNPKPGDIVLFPSSLHHRTIPFTSDVDRVVVAFDLQPVPSSDVNANSRLQLGS